MLRCISKFKNHYPSMTQFNPYFLLSGHISTGTELSPENDVTGARENASLKSCPDDYTTVHMIRQCTRNDWFCLGQQLHCRITGSGQSSNVFVSTALINMYVDFEVMNEARKVFDEMPHRSLVSWNSLISGYVRSGQCSEALNMFLQLESSDLHVDAYSFSSALSACGHVCLLKLGKSIHSKVVKLGVVCSIVVANCLIDMYGKCGVVEDSREVFSEMSERDVISFNSVIAANARNGSIAEALSFLRRMDDPDTISYNEVISGVAQFGEMEDAIAILFSMPHPNASSWNSVITGCVNRNRVKDGLEFFKRMHLAGFRMDQFTYSSILSGVASLSAILNGEVIHCCTVKCGFDSSVVVGSSLVDMYAKCGKIAEAEIVFHSLPCKNLITWNTMLSGYAHVGEFDKVIQLFKELIKVKDLRPDGITFLNVLSACWHSRMAMEGANEYFVSMVRDYAIKPEAEHVSNMVRIMGWEGRLHLAGNMIRQLGFESCVEVWRALLSTSVGSGDVEVAELAAEMVMRLESNSEYVYVLMSNVYACNAKWKDVLGIRALMRGRKVRKEVAHSRIEQ